MFDKRTVMFVFAMLVKGGYKLVMNVKLVIDVLLVV